MKGNTLRESSHQENHSSEITGMAENEGSPGAGLPHTAVQVAHCTRPFRGGGVVRTKTQPIAQQCTFCRATPTQKERHHSLCIKTLST